MSRSRRSECSSCSYSDLFRRWGGRCGVLFLGRPALTAPGLATTYISRTALTWQVLRGHSVSLPSADACLGKACVADISTKSANYCAAYTSVNVGLLLLCEVELGSHHSNFLTQTTVPESLRKSPTAFRHWGLARLSLRAGKTQSGCIQPYRVSRCQM
jgi:hypothetical protein